MNLDTTTIVLFAIAALLGIAYIMRRNARVKRQRRRL